MASVEEYAHSLTGGMAPVTTFLDSLPARPRLLGLGEPTHLEEALGELRNEIFRHLVEHEGYRAFALESDCLMGLAVDDHVVHGTGTLEEAMARGFSHGFGASPANRELVRWMRAYNAGRPEPERLRFFGFDAPLEMTLAASPRQALTALHAYLVPHLDPGLLPCSAATLDRLLGADDRWANPDAAMDPARSVGRSAEARELRLLADDLVALLDAHTPHLLAATPPAAWWRARLSGRTATGLLRYHFWMADTSDQRVARMMCLRDGMMAANLQAVAEHGPALVHAHNRHLQRELSTWQLADLPLLRWWSAGAITGARLGHGYAFLATAVGAIRHHGLGDPNPGTVEGVLSALPDDTYLVDARRLAAGLAGVELTPRTDQADRHGYFPLDPAHLADLDGIVFMKDVRPGVQMACRSTRSPSVPLTSRSNPTVSSSTPGSGS
ncbi:MAG TPA: erythromycin esterase family protein [Nonomuraea sp.]|nr:erythromycin esterase family protein [Nonomuraea sp.]